MAGSVATTSRRSRQQVRRPNKGQFHVGADDLHHLGGAEQRRGRRRTARPSARRSTTRSAARRSSSFARAVLRQPRPTRSSSRASPGTRSSLPTATTRTSPRRRRSVERAHDAAHAQHLLPTRRAPSRPTWLQFEQRQLSAARHHSRSSSRLTRRTTTARSDQGDRARSDGYNITAYGGWCADYLDGVRLHQRELRRSHDRRHRQRRLLLLQQREVQHADGPGGRASGAKRAAAYGALDKTLMTKYVPFIPYQISNNRLPHLEAGQELDLQQLLRLPDPQRDLGGLGPRSRQRTRWRGAPGAPPESPTPADSERSESVEP